MATRIQGIKITIGGETSGFNKAISAMDKEIKSTQKSLNDVNKLLKLDPKNTELLAQKQKLLSESIGKTKDKLEGLKQASEQAQKQLESGAIDQNTFDALQRDIIRTEQELQKLEDQMASMPTDKVEDASEKFKSMGENIKDAGSKVEGAGKALLPVTAAITGLGAAAIKTTMDFEQQMSKVQAIAGSSLPKTEDEINSLKEAAKNMGLSFEEGADATTTAMNILEAKARQTGADTKLSATEAAQAMEYMGMAGWNAGQMLEGMNGIVDLSIASGEDLGHTSDIVTDALTGFGMSAEESTRLADVMCATITSANTDVSMLGESFKYAAPLAGALGYSVEDVSLALGLMGNAGIKASQAGTTLRSLFTRMSKQPKEAAEAMERLGVSMYDSEGKMYSFREIMDQLRGSFGHINMPIDEFNAQIAELDAKLEDGTLTQNKYDKALEELTKQAYGAEGAEKARAAAMLAGTTGMSGLLAIVNASAEDYNKLADSIDNSAGSAAEMRDVMSDNLAGAIDSIKSKLAELGIKFGELLLPYIKQFTTFIQGLIDKLNGMNESTQRIVAVIAIVVAAIGPLLIIVGKIMQIVGSFMTVMPALGPVLTAITGPIGIVVAAIAALVAIFVAAYQHSEEFRDKVNSSIETVKGMIEATIPLIQEAVSAFLEFLKGLWDQYGDNIMRSVELCWDHISNTIQTTIGVIQGLLEVIIGVLTGDWKRAMEGAKKAVKSAFEGMANAVKTTISHIGNMIDGLVKALADKLNLGDKAREWGQDMIQGFVDGINSMIDSVVSTVEGLANDVAEFLHFSRPDKGPLRDYETWMPDFIGGLSKTMEQSMPTLQKTVSKVADSMQLQPSLQFAGSGATTAGSGFDLNGLLNGLRQMNMVPEVNVYLSPDSTARALTDTVVKNISITRRDLQRGGGY